MSGGRAAFVGGALAWLLVLAVVALGYIGQERQHAEAERAAMTEEGQP